MLFEKKVSGKMNFLVSETDILVYLQVPQVAFRRKR